ncbi:MAG: hypothetical protein QXV17_02625 [Candidatus Micrarchaeaceae archaeon]|uniref:hypothetical protein n=1 Tax=Metallosphaera sp. TaxID=2020860 RepID=UPI0031632BB4
MSDKWEVVDEDEEIVGEEEEAVGEEEGTVEADEEPVEDREEQVVTPPRVADPVYTYILGVGNAPESLGEWRFYDLLAELRKAEALGYRDRAKRIRRLVFMYCPYKPRRCPIYTIEVEKCPLHMEKSCRALAFHSLRKSQKKTRTWFHG